MKKVAVIGSPGAGKSTFSRRLGDVTGLEVHHLDQLYWRPGWVEIPRSAFISLQQRLVQNESWIIDGNYGGTMEIRVQAADTIIFIDLPRRVCMWRAVKRAIQYRGKSRPNMAEGCAEKIDIEFLRYIWRFRKDKYPNVLKYVEGARREGKTVIWLKSKEAVRNYLAAKLHNEPVEG